MIFDSNFQKTSPTLSRLKSEKFEGKVSTGYTIVRLSAGVFDHPVHASNSWYLILKIINRQNNVILSESIQVTSL